MPSGWKEAARIPGAQHWLSTALRAIGGLGLVAGVVLVFVLPMPLGPIALMAGLIALVVLLGLALALDLAVWTVRARKLGEEEAYLRRQDLRHRLERIEAALAGDDQRKVG